MSMRALAYAALLFAPVALSAQNFSTSPCTGEDANASSHWFSSGARACEVRKAILTLVDGRIGVDGQNGGIEVSGEARQDIALEAKVTAQGSNQVEAQSILREITIDTQGTIRARGPKPIAYHGWSVSYRLRVPRQVAATLKTENGSLSLKDLDGTLEGTTTNGSLKLSGLAGDVHVRTTNGGVSASLDGAGWHGRGLSVITTNGGIDVTLSPNYSAHLIASTTNGGIHVDRPNGGNTHGHNVDTQLGNGGPTIMFQTTNGGVSIR